MKEIQEEEKGRQTAYSGLKYGKYTDVSVGNRDRFFLTWSLTSDVFAAFPHQVTSKCWTTFRRTAVSNPVRGFY